MYASFPKTGASKTRGGPHPPGYWRRILLNPFTPSSMTEKEAVWQGFWRITFFCGLFYMILYLLPSSLVPPYADHDLYMSIVEVWRRQWLRHGHPLEVSWLFGGG